MADDVINQLLCSRRLLRVNLNLIACLEPVKQDDHYFHAEILVCKFHLGSRKTCLRMRRRFCHQDFYAKMFPRKFFSLGQCFMQNHQEFRSYLKKPSKGGGGIHLSPKKNSRRVNKMHVVHLEFSSNLNSFSCTHGWFELLMLYLI